LQFTIFGLTLSSAWGNGHATPYRAILRALHERGARVTFYEKDAPYYARHRDFRSVDYCDLILYHSWDQVRNEALLRVSESDVVMLASYCPEGTRIADDLLDSKCPLSVFYDLDTPITLQGLASGEVEYIRREQIPGFDLYLSFTGGRILHRLEQEFGARCVRPLYGCVDPDIYRRVTTIEKFTCSLSYMGTYAPDRQKKLDQLLLEPARRRPEWRYLLAGSLYPQDWTWPPNVRHYEHVAPSDHPALYSSSRTTLNLTRKEMAEAGYCPSGRFFEAAACATPILTDGWKGLDHFFNPATELSVVRTAEDVLQSLDRPDGELREMAELARCRTLDEHTGARRAEQLLDYCEEASHGGRVAMEVAS
jgi:spore maturation protein CgeB